MNAPDRWPTYQETEADELIQFGDFTYMDIIEAIRNASPQERKALCNYMGSDNCSLGIELHRLLRSELVRKMGR
jgi:O6-methylguanine-DNA--protein-cysteine methyltransferase